MRNLASLALATFTVVGLASAQSPLLLGQPLTSANQGNVGGGVYLNLQVNTTLTINSITYVASDTTPLNTNSSFEIYIGPSTYIGNVNVNPGPWVLVGSSTPVLVNTGAATADTVVVGVVQPAGANPGTVTFPPGNYGIALRAIGHSWGYQNGAFTFSNSDLVATTGGASNAFLALPTFSPRTVNGQIAYTLGGSPMQFASREAYGDGCYARYQSFYEFYPNPATGFDLSNSSLLLTYNSGSNTYNASAGTTMVNLAAVTSAPLVLTVSGNATVTLDPSSAAFVYADIGGTGVAAGQVDVGADGYITFIPGANPPGGAANNPTIAAFLNGAARVGLWTDLDPVSGGTVHYDFDTANQLHLFTWNMVLSRQTPNVSTATSTFQIAIAANGNIEFRFGTLNLQGGNFPSLLGYTPGNGALDPGTQDISGTVPFSTSNVDSDPLKLDADANPVIGTTVNLTTSDESVSPGIGLFIASTTPLVGAPINLNIIGAPNCFAHLGTLDFTSVIGNFTPFSMVTQFAVPNSMAFIGFDIACQSIFLNPAINAAGLQSSNGVLLSLGAF